MKVLKVILIAILAVSLSITFCYAGKGNDKEKPHKPAHAGKALNRQNLNRQQIKAAIRYSEQHSRWSYNPNDTRGQGNMGQPDMLDPYGHDKDSGRMELYGNRGRVIKEVIPPPEPEPTPEPPPEPPSEPPQEPPPEPPPEPDPYYPPF